MSSQRPTVDAPVPKQMTSNFPPVPHKLSGSGKLAAIGNDESEQNTEGNTQELQEASAKVNGKYPKEEATGSKAEESHADQAPLGLRGRMYCVEGARQLSEQGKRKAGKAGSSSGVKTQPEPDYRFKKGQQVTKRDERDPNDKTKKIRRRYWVCCRQANDKDKDTGEYRLKYGPNEGDGWVGGKDEWIQGIALEEWEDTWTDEQNY